MTFDRTIPPHRLSPTSWQHGYDEMALLFEIHENGDDEPEQDDRRDDRDRLLDLLSEMDAVQLRAYIDGMHTRLAENLW